MATPLWKHPLPSRAIDTARRWGFVLVLILAAPGLGPFPAISRGQDPPRNAPKETGPIRQHPRNGHWFEWRGRPAALIAGGEHYGAVLNRDFDFARYLETLQRDGLNLTRTFTGAYVEPQGAFGIERNTLAPRPEAFLAPWVKIAPRQPDQPPRYDLDRFDPAYLERLRAFLAEADRRGVVVELVLFSSTYGRAQWSIHPFNPANNLQKVGPGDFRKLHTLDNNGCLKYQEALVRQLVTELNDFDNMYFEIQNEPWADNSIPGEQLYPYWVEKTGFPNAVQIPTAATLAWQTRIAQIITQTETDLPKRHMIAQNLANFRLAIRSEEIAEGVSLVNFHYALPEAATWNRGGRWVLGCNETGFAGRRVEPYARDAWRFLFSGGALYNHLDYTFSVGHEDGSDETNNAPGGTTPEVRRRLAVLARFLGGCDLGGLRPDPAVIVRAEGVGSWALSEPGRQLAAYFEGRGPARLTLDLAAGRWSAQWVDPHTGALVGSASLDHPGGALQMESPVFEQAIALRMIKGR